MRIQVDKLTAIAHKPVRKIIGLMSGTSLDGLDIALCEIQGSGIETQVSLLAFKTLEYSVSFRHRLSQVCSKPNVSLQKLCQLNVEIAMLHSTFINQFLQAQQLTPEMVDLVASHGQTVFHAPATQKDAFNSTLQMGDGDHIALQTGIITVSDFRQKHIAAGGQGAPLATYGDYLLYSSTEESRVLLNLGGIANFTYLPKKAMFNNTLSSDTGPGNTLLDAYIRRHFPDLNFDENAKVSIQGRVNSKLLNKLLSHHFFKREAPKTTGQEDFNLNWLESILIELAEEAISQFDIAATLVELSAITIANSIQAMINHNDTVNVYASGGGVHNPLLMQRIQSFLKPHQLAAMDCLGISADAKEAVLFAVLANECVAGKSETFQTDNKFIPNVAMGKLSFPS